MLKPALIAAALIAATGAHAQKADEYRAIASSDEAVIMASTVVTGPQNARRLTEALVRRSQSDNGADAYLLNVTLDCGAGTLTIGKVDVYQGTEIVRQIDAPEDGTSTPTAGSMAEVVLIYGCTGKTEETDPGRPVGIPAAITYALKLQGR